LDGHEIPYCNPSIRYCRLKNKGYIGLFSLTFVCYISAMTKEPPNVVLEQLRVIRDEIRDVHEEQNRTSHKIGAMAESMVSMSRQIEGLRTDMRMVALAVDEHTTRLDRIEASLHHHNA
jgi:hypothetical protein